MGGTEVIEALIHFAAVVAGYVAGLWVARGQERQRAAELEAALASMRQTCDLWQECAEERKRMIVELTEHEDE